MKRLSGSSKARFCEIKEKKFSFNKVQKNYRKGSIPTAEVQMLSINNIAVPQLRSRKLFNIKISVSILDVQKKFNQT